MNTILPAHVASTRPSVPQDTRVYAIGDVHGRADLLRRLLKSIAADAASTRQRCVLVTLGDYVDRGPDSADVLEQLATLAAHPVFKTFERHFLKGNHEYMMEQFLLGQDPDKAWMNSGGSETLASYGADDTLEQAQQLVPKHHQQFLSALGLIHEEGDYAFAHAGVRPGVTLSKQNADDVMWIRAPFLSSRSNFGAVIVHGHTPADVPYVLDNRIAIDTRAWLSGTLTALVLEDSQQRFLST